MKTASLVNTIIILILHIWLKHSMTFSENYFASNFLTGRKILHLTLFNIVKSIYQKNSIVAMESLRNKINFISNHNFNYSKIWTWKWVCLYTWYVWLKKSGLLVKMITNYRGLIQQYIKYITIHTSPVKSQGGVRGQQKLNIRYKLYVLIKLGLWGINLKFVFIFYRTTLIKIK